jgi:hypothetical protein
VNLRAWAYKAFHAPRPVDVSAPSLHLGRFAMSLQSRAHRRMQRHRPTPAASPPSSSGEALLDYLRAAAVAAAPTPAPQWQGRLLRDAAHELMASGEPLRLGLRAGELPHRINWFLCLLELWPADEREEWLRAQVQAAQRHALAGSPLHDALDLRLFDRGLSADQRLRVQSLWLAAVAPGAVSLDETRREREQAEAMALLHRWLG